MKTMKLIVIIFLTTFAIASCQEDKVFKEQVTFEKGFKFLDGTSMNTAATGGSMVYPATGIPLSTGTAWGASITNNSANWNTAFSWGNHATAGYALATHNHNTQYKPISYVPTWAEITGKPSEVDLQTAISQLNVLVIPKKTTAEITAMTPTAGSLVYDVTLNVLKIGNGVLWKTLITNQ